MKPIVGPAFSLGLPKPDMMQTDPKKGSFVHGKEEFARQHIPAPATAKVGQCIVVAAVDENGVVTATEAATIEILEDAAGVAF